ncbi:hypothetical protein GW17_00038024 [Ensete ventricosum]|nr:hypothetical protein GW17_00038024 [Ensete ventricosum]
MTSLQHISKDQKLYGNPFRRNPSPNTTLANAPYKETTKRIPVGGENDGASNGQVQHGKQCSVRISATSRLSHVDPTSSTRPDFGISSDGPDFVTFDEEAARRKERSYHVTKSMEAI